uniref:hypothetical protein n=1 Tax=Sediminibacterium sp. TaxID=1917865 RepID=UPI003F70E18D
HLIRIHVKLKKENYTFNWPEKKGSLHWELAVYPIEDHGFVEPSSWTDEYKRILKLFNERLLKR